MLDLVEGEIARASDQPTLARKKYYHVLNSTRNKTEMWILPLQKAIASNGLAMLFARENSSLLSLKNSEVPETLAPRRTPFDHLIQSYQTGTILEKKSSKLTIGKFSLKILAHIHQIYCQLEKLDFKAAYRDLDYFFQVLHFDNRSEKDKIIFLNDNAEICNMLLLRLRLVLEFTLYFNQDEISAGLIQAEQLIKLFEQIQPEDIAIRHQKRCVQAAVFFHRGRYKEAIAEYGKVIDEDGSVYGIALRAKALMKLKEFKSVQEDCDRIEKSSLHFLFKPIVYAFRLNIADFQDDWREAIKQFNQLKEKNILKSGWSPAIKTLEKMHDRISDFEAKRALADCISRAVNKYDAKEEQQPKPTPKPTRRNSLFTNTTSHIKTSAFRPRSLSR